ncbi:MAG: (2Fe-2S)-binding protein [Glaciihabitans sp.]|nr:(2Fe-2S)-binding protein [Glaciihabitans sp.]
MKEARFVKAVVALEDATVLDPAVKVARGLVMRVIRPQVLRDTLHGVPIGHPVHPLIVTVPIGAWASVALLDLLPNTERTSRILVGLGLATVLPAVATGYTDWSELHEQQMRVGLVHSAANAAAASLYAVSLVQRIRGRHGSGKLFSYAGLLMASAGGYLGGHLSYRQAAGVNHTEDVPHRFPEGWQPLGQLEDLPNDTLTKRDVAGVPLLVLRRGSHVDVLANSCSHLSGPLDEGTLATADGGETCVQCPWHNSVFSMRTGEVLQGPATSPQPKFETEVADGEVRVMLPGAG